MHFELPEVLPEAIAVVRELGACLLEDEAVFGASALLASHWRLRNDHAWVEVLVVLGGDAGDIRPVSECFALLFPGSDPEPVGRPGHEVGDDALVRLPLVYLPELLRVVDPHPDPVLEHVVQRALLQVRGVAPGHLDRCRGLCHQREGTLAERVFVQFEGMLVLATLKEAYVSGRSCLVLARGGSQN